MSANILVIEYEPRYLEHVRAALSDGDFRLEIAGNMDDAVNRCAHFEPTIVIITSVLPNLRVEDAITQLRARAGLRITPVLILMSGYQGSDPKKDALRYGAQDLLQRPFGRDDLRERVEELVATAPESGRHPGHPAGDAGGVAPQRGSRRRRAPGNLRRPFRRDPVGCRGRRTAAGRGSRGREACAGAASGKGGVSFDNRRRRFFADIGKPQAALLGRGQAGGRGSGRENAVRDPRGPRDRDAGIAIAATPCGRITAAAVGCTREPHAAGEAARAGAGSQAAAAHRGCKIDPGGPEAPPGAGQARHSRSGASRRRGAEVAGSKASGQRSLRQRSPRR